jgi:hypothetical protein
MVRLQFRKFSDPGPTWVDGSVLAVPAEPFDDVDQGQGGITHSDIADETVIAPVDRFPVGAEVYIESEDAEDCLFDETPEEERASRIWWRATVLAPEGR